ncbi:MAG TPA: acyl-CoA desaturase, partial [Solimonas sp.]
LGIVSELRPLPAHVLNGSRVISAETKERIAQALAHRFCPDRIVHRMQKRWVELNRGHAIADWRRHWAAQLSVRREQLLHNVHAELPSLDQLYRHARRRFARTPAMEEIVARARELIAHAVIARLETVPAHA